MKKIIFILCLFLCAGSASAVNFDKKKNLVGLGLSYGGDNFGSAGADELNAGEDASLYYGRVLLSDNPATVQAAIGYKFDTVNASNGDVWFTRYPAELLTFYSFQSFRLGAGVSYHINPVYEEKLDISNNRVKFDNALGFLLQFDFFSHDFLSAGIRYENITYDSPVFWLYSDGTIKKKFDGSSIGFNVNYHF
ncbi:MAG: hypothetical protein D6698_00685 [Gammaproteobacteria bacterium]|nr:MAG: hypothetical protein D6698_00685 [Gammaproteobacteria bacterium]